MTTQRGWNKERPIRSTLRWPLLCAMITFAPISYGQPGVRPTPTQPRNIELIASSQPGFEAAIDADFPGFRHLDGFETVRPYLTILHNNSGHDIKAYAVKWNITGLNGRNSERTLVSWVRGGRGYLSGEVVVCRSGEARVISPLFNWGASPTTVAARSKLFSSLARGPFARDGSVFAIDVSIDAVVYDDAVCTGPNRTEFCERYEDERNGERDEAADTLQLLELNTPDDLITARLNSDMEKGRTVADRRDRSSFLESARGREARVLLAIFKRDG